MDDSKIFELPRPNIDQLTPDLLIRTRGSSKILESSMYVTPIYICLLKCRCSPWPPRYLPRRVVGVKFNFFAIERQRCGIRWSDEDR